MATINDLIKDMKDLAELEKFAEQQYKTILDLNKKNTNLQSEVEHLKTLLEATTPGITSDLNKISSPNEPHEKLICEIQLRRLNEISMERELTAEESKKVETYSKILATFRVNKKSDPKPIEAAPTAELLRLVQNDSE